MLAGIVESKVVEGERLVDGFGLARTVHFSDLLREVYQDGGNCGADPYPDRKQPFAPGPPQNKESRKSKDRSSEQYQDQASAAAFERHQNSN